jgi:hypothetical protein
MATFPYYCFMNKMLFSAILMLAPAWVYCQDDVVPMAPPPVVVAPETEMAKLGTEARAKLNVEWMYNTIPGLESSRIECLLNLNRSFLDSFARCETWDANTRLKAQQRAVEQREAALRECLGKSTFEILLELREKNAYIPGKPAQATAAAVPAPATPQAAPAAKKGKSVPATAPSAVSVPPAALSDSLEGEQKP